jgi:triosephosphate isomerase
MAPWGGNNHSAGMLRAETTRNEDGGWTAMAQPLIAGNWKMNGRKADGTALAGAIAGGARSGAADLLVCPPATLIDAVAAALGDAPVALGGQDCHPEPAGAHTGDVSAEMLADLGCRFVIVGHSERRTDHGEDDATVRAKALAAHRAGLTAIVCVGETEAERDAGRAVEVVSARLQDSVPETAGAHDTVIAYEPVWAIGTGRSASLDDIAEVHGAIRETLRRIRPDAAEARILYGGSVKPDNAQDILGLANVDGALVGGASLKAESFLAIATSCR